MKKNAGNTNFVTDLRTILCTIILISTLLYSGRAIYAIFIMSIFMFSVMYKNISRNDSVYIVLLLFFTAVQVLVFAYKGYPTSAIINVIILYIPFIVFVLRNGLTPENNIFSNIIYALDIVINIAYIIQYASSGYSRKSISLLGASINYFASLNCIILCFLFYRYSKKENRTGVLYAAMGFSILAVITSLSRTCIAISLVSLVSYACFNFFRSDNSHRTKTFLKYILLGVLLGIGTIQVYIFLYNRNSAFKDSMDSFRHYFESIRTVGIGLSRNVLWENAVSKINDNFIFGSGSPQVLNISSELIAPHNFILEIVLLAGILGIFIYVIICGHMLYVCKKQAGREQKFFIWLLCIVYWGIAIFQPFLSTAYFYNTLFGFILIGILKDSQREGGANV